MTGRHSGIADPAIADGAPAVGAVADAPVAARLRRHLRNPLNSNVYALMANTVLSSLLGVAYWAIAARLYTTAELGIGAALVSTMTFLSNLSQLNLNGTLARFLPAAGRQGTRLVGYAYGTSCLVALAISGAFLAITPFVADQFDFLHRGPLLALCFALAVAGWGVFTLQDSVLTALRGVVWVPVENALFSVLKIALLVLLAGAAPSLGIFVSWNLAVVAALIPVNVLVFRRLLPRLHARGDAGALPGRRALARFVALDYVGYLFMQAGTNALPLIVTARLGAEANGVFYVAWLLGSSAELVAYHFGTSLTVEAAADESRLATYTRQMLRRALLLFTPAVVLLCASAPLLLTLFGEHYAGAGANTLRLFAIAVLPKLVVIVFVAASRVQRRVGRIILVNAAASTLVLSLTLVTIDELGVTGVGVAYLAAQLLVAGAVLPALLRLVRGTP
ncbi:lipopolysaccharide biosynthesis protein [Dactylosporangium sp. CA-139066]|uniref:lipopolysaccharide biosynthesis protein n=1 Tax=Dactylosporangium sp. CA-139066 TaxID=3239930 RepID=UPI003D9078C3